MLSPKRTKYRKYHFGALKNTVHNLNKLQFGRFGIKSCESKVILGKTLEAVRRVLRKQLKKTGFIWTRLFPDQPVTAKPAEVRMGKGKGNTSHWITKVRPGQIIYEMDGVSLSLAKKAALSAHYKLPFESRFVVRENPHSIT